MKHLLIELTYAAPPERIDAIVGAHRAFLQTGYDSGLLLYLGRQAVGTGAIILARPPLEVLQQLFAADPYQQAGVAEYRFVEWTPVKFQPCLQAWVVVA